MSSWIRSSTGGLSVLRAGLPAAAALAATTRPWESMSWRRLMRVFGIGRGGVTPGWKDPSQLVATRCDSWKTWAWALSRTRKSRLAPITARKIKHSPVTASVVRA
jgi:hypothetical protein